jgi:hypothetical protein
MHFPGSDQPQPDYPRPRIKASESLVEHLRGGRSVQVVIRCLACDDSCDLLYRVSPGETVREEVPPADPDCVDVLILDACGRKRVTFVITLTRAAVARPGVWHELQARDVSDRADDGHLCWWFDDQLFYECESCKRDTRFEEFFESSPRPSVVLKFGTQRIVIKM